jgi:hypothetical protein
VRAGRRLLGRRLKGKSRLKAVRLKAEGRAVIPQAGRLLNEKRFGGDGLIVSLPSA